MSSGPHDVSYNVTSYRSGPLRTYSIGIEPRPFRQHTVRARWRRLRWTRALNVYFGRFSDSCEWPVGMRRNGKNSVTYRERKGVAKSIGRHSVSPIASAIRADARNPLCDPIASDRRRYVVTFGGTLQVEREKPSSPLSPDSLKPRAVTEIDARE